MLKNLDFLMINYVQKMFSYFFILLISKIIGLFFPFPIR